MQFTTLALAAATAGLASAVTITFTNELCDKSGHNCQNSTITESYTPKNLTGTYSSILYLTSATGVDVHDLGCLVTYPTGAPGPQLNYDMPVYFGLPVELGQVVCLGGTPPPNATAPAHGASRHAVHFSS